MDGNQNQKNMGEQIKDAVTDALQSGDFRILNDLVVQTVTDTLNEVGKQIVKNVVPRQDSFAWEQRTGERKKQEEFGRQEEYRRQEERRQEEYRRQEERRQEEYRRQEERRQEEYRRQEERRQEAERRRQEEVRRRVQPAGQYSVNVPAVRKKNVGSVSGVLYQVFGGIGLGVAGLAMFVKLLLSLFGVSVNPVSLLFHLIVLAGFAGMVGAGIGKRKRLKRADRYVALCGAKMYGNIEKLAKDTGNSSNFVIRDIRKMLKAGMFPEGHLDEQKTCFMLTDAVYEQYLEAERSRLLREEEEKKANMQDAAPSGQGLEDETKKASAENELNAMVAQGMDCIRRLRELNDQIEGEVISEKLSRLENLLKEIFDSLREHPEQMHRMHKPMDYYLPTTLKLVEAYEEFDRVSVPGEEVLQAKAEIERTLDIINQAFAELLNNLFQDTVFDVTTDAKVLASMLAREGLTKDMKV